jgi:hypothetical protein
MGTGLAREAQRSPLSSTKAKPYRSNAELNSTALSGVPGPVSDSARQNILQCYVLVYPKLLLPWWLCLQYED